MTMATPYIRETPQPRYEGTVVCGNCHAEFKPEDWFKISYVWRDTSGRFAVVGKAVDGGCPICNKIVEYVERKPERIY